MSGMPQPGQMSTGEQSAGAQVPGMMGGQMPWMGMQQAGFNPAMMQAASGNPAMMQGFMTAFQQQGQGNFNPAMLQAMQQQQQLLQQQMQQQQQQQQQQHGNATPGQPQLQQQQHTVGGVEMDKAQAIQQCVEALSAVESEYYTYLWQNAGAEQGALHGRAAFEFLSKSNLPRETLKRIWDLADWQKLHYLRWQEFVVTMKLISAAQKKQLVSLERVMASSSPSSRDCPEFEGVKNVNVFKGGEGADHASQAAPPAVGNSGFADEGAAALASLAADSLGTAPTASIGEPGALPGMAPSMPSSMPASMPAVAVPAASTNVADEVPVVHSPPINVDMSSGALAAAGAMGSALPVASPTPATGSSHTGGSGWAALDEIDGPPASSQTASDVAGGSVAPANVALSGVASHVSPGAFAGVGEDVGGGPGMEVAQADWAGFAASRPVSTVVTSTTTTSGGAMDGAWAAFDAVPAQAVGESGGGSSSTATATRAAFDVGGASTNLQAQAKEDDWAAQWASAGEVNARSTTTSASAGAEATLPAPTVATAPVVASAAPVAPDDGEKWDAFGDASFQSSTPVPQAQAVPKDVVDSGAQEARPRPSTPDPGSGADDSWAAFGSGLPAPPAPATTAAAVTAPLAQDASTASGGVAAAGADSWADFAGGGGFATASPAAAGGEIGGATANVAAASVATTGSSGGLWAKMSAFDDLLREDDMLGGPLAKNDLEEAFRAEAAESAANPTPETSVPAADAVVDLFSASPPAAPESSTSLFDANNDDDAWGGFETAGADGGITFPDTAAQAPATTADVGGISLAGIAAAASTLGAPSPRPDVSGGSPGEEPKADFVASFDDGFGDLGGVGAASGAAVASEAVGSSTSGGVGFAAFDEGDFAAPAATSIATESSATQPAVVTASDLDFGFDDEPLTAGSKPPAPAAASGASGFGDGDAFGFDFPEPSTTAFPAPLPAPAPSQVTTALTLMGSTPAAISQPPAAASGDAAWDAFDFDAGTTAATSLSTSAPGGVGLGAASSDLALGEDASWASFGFDDGPAQPTQGSTAEGLVATSQDPTGTGMSLLSPPPAASSTFSASFTLPSAGVAPTPSSSSDAPAVDTVTAAKAAEAAKEPISTQEEEARRLAIDLALRGFLEEAERCQANAEAVRRLAAAEAKKKEKIAQDDFEGAIQTREEIKAISAQLLPDEEQEAWRQIVAKGTREDCGVVITAERLRQRCQYLDDVECRAALCVAVGNFRSTASSSSFTPSVSAPSEYSDLVLRLPGLVKRQRRCRLMARALESLSVASVMQCLQVLMVCLGVLAELMSMCSASLGILASSEWSKEERDLAVSAEEFQSLLRSLSVLRRIHWRLGLSADLLLPNGVTESGGPTDSEGSAILGLVADLRSEVSAADSRRLQDLHVKAVGCMTDAKAAWSQVEARLAGLELNLGEWNCDMCFEAASGASCPSAAGQQQGLLQQQRVGPLCVLCLLPAAPLGSAHEASIGAASSDVVGAASAPWRGGVWHVSCANFWIRHGAPSKQLKDLGMPDPYCERT